MLEMKQSSAGNYAVCRRVWQRVDPQQDPYPERGEAGAKLPEPGLQMLEELAVRKRQERWAYQVCARRMPLGAMRQKLHQLAAEKEGQAHRLLAAYFLLTGQQVSPPIPVGKEKREDWRQMLRQRWLEELESADRMEHMARRLPELEDLLRSLAHEDRRHGDLLLRMLAQSLA